MGSVKDLRVIRQPVENEMGEGVFEFSDRYSIFDYGEMPDHIEDKGKALCLMAAANFRELERKGIKTHFISLDADNELRVKLVRKIPVDRLTPFSRNCMIPLEIIFRDALPEGSSVFKRIKNKETTWQALGLDHECKPGERLKRPIIDFSTKFETFDRYFKNTQEVIDYYRLGPEKMKDIQMQALMIADYLRNRAAKIGWEHMDGKVEGAIDTKGDLMWVDVFGTLDEDRFELNGFVLSKQFLRDYYKKTTWYAEFMEAKENTLPAYQWPKPPKLPPELAKFVSDLYKSACNEWTGERHFDVKPLRILIDEDYKELKKSGMLA
jgi:phosphoribosylaminoimidazole-succinocarboxamide synthase